MVGARGFEPLYNLNDFNILTPEICCANVVHIINKLQ
jgi:hypothetical protein